jgi:aminopeptidase N
LILDPVVLAAHLGVRVASVPLVFRAGSSLRPRTVLLLLGAACALVIVGCSGGAGVQRGAVETTRATLSAPRPNPTLVPDTVGSTTVGAPSSPSAPVGASGVGDALFPDLGNPGVDVDHYDIDLAYDPPTHHLEGTVTLQLHLTTAMRQFTLDSDGPQVSAVTVDGVAAAFLTASPELVIALPVPVTTPRAAVVVVSYALDPAPIPSPGGLTAGWYPTAGGSYVLNEPDGARSWLPSNDHLSDKATYRFQITVPTGFTAVANGAPAGHRSAAGKDTWVWDETRPMTTYVISVLTGKYDLVDGVGPHGLPLLHAVLHDDRELMQPFLDVTAAQITFFEQYFGPYPFDRYGVSITDSAGGDAMETQERSLFSRDDFATGTLGPYQQLLLSHELSHQWFGDAVTPARWKDIWLNESFATYAEWMWLDHVGDGKIDDLARAALSQRSSRSPADPTADQLFDTNSYDGGAVTLHALRRTIGDDAFFTLLRTWVQSNLGGTRTTDDFVALAAQVAGRDLGPFFATWLFAPTVPAKFP